jgi:GT2 family glycosyltransferase
LNNHKDAAACQPKLLSYSDKTKFEYAGAAGGYLDMFGYPFCRGRLFDKCEKDNGQYDDINEVFWATGACMFVRASDFFAAGGFDSDFFAHMEEIDLCWRLKNTGKKIFFIPDSVVYHVGGGTLQKQNPFKTYLNFRNSLFTLIKNLRKRELYKIPVRLFLDGLAGVRFFLMGEFGNVRAVINSHISFYKYFIKMWKKRKSIKKLSAHTGVYKHSVILAHFFRNKGKFSELKIR